MATSTGNEIICRHKTTVRLEYDGEHEICRLCGQEMLLAHSMEKYLHGHPTIPKPVILKRGSIDGQITMIHPPPLETSPSPQEAEKQEEKLTEKQIIPAKPEIPPGSSNLEKGKIMAPWYEANRANITADIERLGPSGAQQQWDISWPAFNDLRRKWGLPVKQYSRPSSRKEKPETASKAKSPPASKAKSPPASKAKSPPASKAKSPETASPRLPEIPAWNEEWPPQVQVAWLEMMGKLHGRER